VYIFSSGYADEVYVNLEHPYNLFHFGKFSMSPFRMIDGTVEFIYYLLLTPFALSQATLIVASLILGYGVCWSHLYLVKRIFREHPIFARG